MRILNTIQASTRQTLESSLISGGESHSGRGARLWYSLAPGVGYRAPPYYRVCGSGADGRKQSGSPKRIRGQLLSSSSPLETTNPTRLTDARSQYMYCTCASVLYTVQYYCTVRLPCCDSSYLVAAAPTLKSCPPAQRVAPPAAGYRPATISPAAIISAPATSVAYVYGLYGRTGVRMHGVHVYGRTGVRVYRGVRCTGVRVYGCASAACATHVRARDTTFVVIAAAGSSGRFEPPVR